MSNSDKCWACQGSGKLTGAGSVKVECHNCDGSGKFVSIDEEIEKLTTEKPESYNKAIEEITNLGVSHEEAKELFREEYRKESKNNRKKG